MRLLSIILNVALISLVAESLGCQSVRRVMYRPGQLVTATPPMPRVILAAYVPDILQTQARNAQSSRSEESADKSAEDESRKRKNTYTEPGPSTRQVALAAASTDAKEFQPVLSGAGRELSEVESNDTIPAGGVVGFSGLTAPQPVARGVVLSLPGLQQGPAAGLGFALPSNVLTPQINLLSGSMGRCQDLARAGFFARDVMACELHFGTR